MYACIPPSLPTPRSLQGTELSSVCYAAGFHLLSILHMVVWASQLALVVKNLPANAGDTRDMGLIPGSERSSGEGHGSPLQYSCLENPMDREASWATVHRTAKSWAVMKQISVHGVYTSVLLFQFVSPSTSPSVFTSPLLHFCSYPVSRRTMV